MKYILVALLFFVTKYSFAQNNYGKQLWMQGNAYTYIVFDGANKPLMRKKNMSNFPKPWYDYVPFSPNTSNICDSMSGELLMNVSPLYIHDSVGNIIEGGDDLLNPIVYSYLQVQTDACHNPQGSIILPRGGRVFDIFVPFYTDSAFINYTSNAADSINAQMNVLLHHVVDMNANNGHGKVIVKKQNILGGGISLIKNGMQAVRHANGKDWWLCKMGYGRLLSDSIFMYTFLVKADTIIGPKANYLGMFTDYMGQSSNYFNKGGHRGQLSFSKDGSQFVFVGVQNFQLLLGGFNRCNGSINEVKFVATPKNQSIYLYGDTALTNITTDQETNLGVIFSPNNRFVYLARDYQIFQWDSYAPDSASAWYAVKLGFDTISAYASYYALMHLGSDDKIIVSTDWNHPPYINGITEPNKKGSACAFVGKYLRLNDSYPYLKSVSNQPNYLLGEDNNVCWPTSIAPIVKGAVNGFTVYPNPSTGSIQLVFDEVCTLPTLVTVYNILGAQIHQQTIPTNTIKHSIQAKFAAGIYVVKIGGVSRRFVVE
jgi:hypothetical protein